MRTTRNVIASLVLCAVGGALLACGGTGETDTGLKEWAGSTPHLKIEGNLDGEQLSFDIGETDASDTTQFWCEREYEVSQGTGVDPDYAGGRLVEFKVVGMLVVGGETRTLELEFKKHDTQSDPVGTDVTIVPRSETRDPSPTEMWLEWEWNDIPSEYEEAAQEGVFSLREFTGTGSAPTSGLVIPENDGTVGGFVSASWSESERVAVSFTVNCTQNEVVIIQ